MTRKDHESNFLDESHRVKSLGMGSSQPGSEPMTGDRPQEHDGRRTCEDDLETCGSYQDISDEWLVSPALDGEDKQIEAQNAEVTDNGKPANPVSP